MSETNETNSNPALEPKTRSTSETGHAKTIANFEAIIAMCLSFGTTYNPSKNGLKITQLITQLGNAKTALQTVKTTETSFENARNARELAFSATVLRRYCTRIVNALAATDASKLTLENAKTINRKLIGKHAKSPSNSSASSKNATDIVNQISVSQLSYDNLIDNFAKLIVCVSAEPLYIPNEADLKVTSLNMALANYRALNTNVINASVPYKSALIARDTYLYQEISGVADVALEVKMYVKSIFGASSPQFKEVNKIKFRNRRIS